MEFKLKVLLKNLKGRFIFQWRFFVISKKALKYIKGDDTSWEIDTLKIIAKKELIAYKHKGFWHAMDTLRDKNYLENLWSQKKAPWKLWD